MFNCTSETSRNVRPAAGRPLTRGFTLVELLVVIGIIALLISILLPTLGSARRQAQTTACVAKLQQIMVAANLHRTDHRDYYPVAGFLPDVQPSDALGDTYAVKYSYLSLTSSFPTIPRLIAPITQALAVEMSSKAQILVPSNTAATYSMFDPTNYGRYFTCPAQGNEIKDLLSVGGRSNASFWGLYAGLGPSGQATYLEPNSYIYNEAVVGFPYGGVYRLAGHGSEVRQPASTIFCADGQGPYGVGSQAGPIGRNANGFDPNLEGIATCSMQTVYNTTSTQSSTLANVFLGQTNIAGPAGAITGNNTVRGVFDPIRHKGRINVAFCDGHVETRNINYYDLQKIFIYAVR